MENKISATTLHALIRTRDGLLFEDDARAVSTGNEQGPLDILPEHENFISIITLPVQITLMNHEKKEFPLDGTSGMMRVYENTVSIYLGVLKDVSTDKKIISQQ